MAAPSNASLPPFFTLTSGMSVRITALDPTDGSEVGAVVLSDMALSVDQDAGPPIGNTQILPAYTSGPETV